MTRFRSRKFCFTSHFTSGDEEEKIWNRESYGDYFSSHAKYRKMRASCFNVEVNFVLLSKPRPQICNLFWPKKTLVWKTMFASSECLYWPFYTFRPVRSGDRRKIHQFVHFGPREKGLKKKFKWKKVENFRIKKWNLFASKAHGLTASIWFTITASVSCCCCFNDRTSCQLSRDAGLF